MEIEKIRQLVKMGKYHYSNHAKDMMFERTISDSQVVETILSGEVLETYTVHLLRRWGRGLSTK